MYSREIQGQLFEVEGNKLYLSEIAQTIKEIRQILHHHEQFHNEEFIEKMNHGVDMLIRHFETIRKIHNNDTDKLLPIVIDFLNNMLQVFGLKKFYNLTPSISYQEYCAMGIGAQIVNNSFDGKLSPDKPCMIKKKYVRGGNCHHRSITIKKIIDQLNLPGVKCSIYKVIDGHSFVVIEHVGKTYMSDILEYDEIMDAKAMNDKGGISAYKILNPEFSDLREFDDIQRFISVVERTKYNSIKLQINKIGIEINGPHIKIEIQGGKTSTKKEFTIQWDKQQKHYTKKALIEIMFPWLTNLLPIISSKIKKEHLTDTFYGELS